MRVRRDHPTHRPQVQANFFHATAIQGRLANMPEQDRPRWTPDRDRALRYEESVIEEKYERSRKKIREDFKKVIDSYAPEAPVDKPANQG